MANITPGRERDQIAILAEMDAIHDKVRRAAVAGDIDKALSFAIEYGTLIERLAQLNRETS